MRCDDAWLAGAAIIVLDLETDKLIPPNQDLSTLNVTIGTAWEYETMTFHWFDQASLDTLAYRWTRHPQLLVTYNGQHFDLPILTRHFRSFGPLQKYRSRWDEIVRESFDLLAAFRQADPEGRFTRGLYRFAQICMANGLGAKRAPQGDIPYLWQTGHYADVMNHCQEDVLLLRQLFVRGYQTNGRYERFGTSLTIPMPDLTRWLPKEHADATSL